VQTRDRSEGTSGGGLLHTAAQRCLFSMQRRCQITLVHILSSAAERVAGMNVPRSPVAWSRDPAHRKAVRWGAVARASNTL
jgi:hypothetical protein